MKFISTIIRSSRLMNEGKGCSDLVASTSQLPERYIALLDREHGFDGTIAIWSERRIRRSKYWSNPRTFPVWRKWARLLSQDSLTVKINDYWMKSIVLVHVCSPIFLIFFKETTQQAEKKEIVRKPPHSWAGCIMDPTMQTGIPSSNMHDTR
jgi:hypothetical protein